MEGIIFIVILVLCLLLIYKGIAENKRNMIRLQETFRKEYGKPNHRVWKLGDIERISYYSNSRASRETIDEITWKDLDMDLIYQQMAFTKSSLGDDYLYALLKNPTQKEQILSDRERKISSMEKEPDVRVKLQSLFAKLGRIKEYSFSKYFEYLLKEKAKSNGKHYMMNAFIMGSFILMLYHIGIGLVCFFFLLLYNIVSYFRDKAYFEPYLVSVRYLFQVMDLANEVAKELPQEWRSEQKEVEEMLSSISKIRKHSFLVMSPGRMGGEGLEIILDYLRMCFHLDIIQFNKMLSGIQQHRDEIWKLCEIMGEIDAYIAIDCYRASMKKVCIPKLVKQRRIEMTEGYHPLIENFVPNSLEMNKNIILTGSNASGKSTFLKTIGINVILAQTIHTCLADKFEMPFCRIYTSLSLKDSIVLKESYYMAEIKAMKRILDSANEGNMVVCMVDEVLRGTNTVERIAASTQILKSLSKENVLCLAATHDVELTYTLEKEYDNYHFEESLEQEDVRFSYRLKNGRADSSNAIHLLEHLGYEKNLVRKAREMVIRFEQQGEWICE